ncbi:MAG: transglycosylase SLT domain-containing protein [Sulfuritalea sp.]|jgi:membrane-bound lytic murein transglycosylase D|nr:transglycosylase SLT domain-containing protein [Sulfuritalea sp.]
MIRLFLALVSSIIASTGTAWAGDESGLRRQSFVYPPMVLEQIGPKLKPEVHLGPVVDRSRAYLLEISEEEFSGKQPALVRNVWDRIRNGFVLPPLRGPLVAERELWYGQRKDLVANISQKARRYLFYIVEAVEKRGLPMELALLPIVESGFEPGAISTAQAAGLWQFIPGTAQRYHLKLNDNYDARRDIVASTEAALDYLEFLHGIFKDWQLALAAYNWGEEAVLRAVQRNQAKGLAADYESLSLPEETRYYVPKLMAIRNIVLSPELHGVELADIPNTPYFAEIDVRTPLDISSVARLAGLPAAEVLALNPSHKSLFISGKGKPAVLLPADRIEAFAHNIANYSSKSPRGIRKPPERKGVEKAIVGLKSLEERPL